MQHSNYKITPKQYIDQKEVAKEMVQYGFRVFPPRPYAMTERQSAPPSPSYAKASKGDGGAYWSRIPPDCLLYEIDSFLNK